MVKKRWKWFTFIICALLFCSLGTTSVAQAAETETTVQTGIYGEFFNVESGKCLNVRKNSSAQNADLTIYSQDGTSGQQWQFLVNGADCYLLIPSCAAGTGRVINIYGYSAQAGSRICLWEATWSDTQTWMVEALSDGSFILRSKNNPDYCLAEAGTANSSAITLKAYSATDKSIRWTSSLVTVKTETKKEEPKEIKLSATSISTYIHIPIQLTLEGADASKVTWTCSSETKGGVNKDGVVRASKKNCSFTVTAKYEGKSYKCKVTVEKNDPKFITFKEKMYWAKKDDVPVYLGPHSSAPVVKKIDKNAVVGIVGELTNKAGNKWYLTSEGYYVYSGNCVKMPEYTAMEDTVLFAQRVNTVVYAAPGKNATVVKKLPIHSYLTMIGELTDLNGTKWYVTYGPDKTGELRYVCAEDFAATPYLSTVPGCGVHYNNCTFCSAMTMIRRRAVHDGICDIASSVYAVTYEMIDCYEGGLKFDPWTYYVNGGTATYTTRTEYFDKNVKPCTVEILKKYCQEHPEGVVIYDSDQVNSANGVLHAVCLGECIPWEDGTYGFYVYDINEPPYWGTAMMRLEDCSLYKRNGYNLQNLLNNITHIVYIDVPAAK